MNLVLLRVSVVFSRANDRHVPEEKRTQLSSTPGVRHPFGAPLHGKRKKPLRGVFRNVAADVYDAAKKGFHNRTRRTIHVDFAVVCVSLCLCRMLRNSVRICVHLCQEFDDLVAVPFSYVARQLENRR